MAKDAFQYIFRFCCDPGFNDSVEIPALLRYVDEACIDDVAVFANVEEINTGHMDFEEQDIYLKMMAQISALLAPKKITMSVNQWHSIMHADLGKTMRSGHAFRPMVDIEGNEASICVCPLCEEWQRYIALLYGRYAQLEPSILWVEDDFRLHNHEPLTWGGCFCEEHMKLYSQQAGRPVGREEFLRGVLQPGPPHPYRKIWLDISRETMLSAARAIAAGVRQMSAKAQIGLMSSAPQIHAAEGRSWHALLQTLAAGRPPVDRVHLPGYQEQAPAAYLQGVNMVSALTCAMLPADTEIYPELENFPFSLFSKSRRFTRFQLLSALPLRVKGITIDLYDLNGNGIVWEEDYQTMLRETKPYLNALAGLGVFGGRRLGVQVLYNQRSAYNLHTGQGKSMEELYPHETFFGGLLPAMGVPFAYCEAPVPEGDIVAASGQVLRNYTPEQIEALFAHNFVILSGDAAFTLVDMGLGHLAGLRKVSWMRQNSGEYAYEEVTNGKVYCGMHRARASAIISCSDVVRMEFAPEAKVEEYSALFNSYRRRTAPCEVVINKKVFVYPFGNFETPFSIPPMLLNNIRQGILQDILAQAGASFARVEGPVYLQPHLFETDEGKFLYLINGSTDTAEGFALAGVHGAQVITVFASHEAAPRRIKCRKIEQGTLVPLLLPSMEAVLLTLPACVETGEV